MVAVSGGGNFACRYIKEAKEEYLLKPGVVKHEKIWEVWSAESKSH